VRDPPDDGAVGLEEHGLLELDLVLGDSDEVVFLGAAVGRDAGLVGAAVLDVGDTVLVVVGVRGSPSASSKPSLSSGSSGHLSS